MAQPTGRVTPAWIAQRAKTFGLDPSAVLAVANQEGLGGGIGDSGTSFGPFQLHYGGAYPSSAPHGASASQEWAWSAPGIDYALHQIQGVAGGLTGEAAVRNIVSRFERPADPAGEIARALGHPVSAPSPDPVSVQLAQPSTPSTTTLGAPAGAAVNPPSLTAVPDRQAFAAALLGGISSTGQLSTDALVNALTARQRLVWR